MMWAKKILVISVVTAVSLMGVVACVPGEGILNPSAVSSSTQKDTSQGSGGEVVVDNITPTTEVEPEGQTAPGGATEGSQPAPNVQNDQIPAGTPVTYNDSTYQFSLSYPDNFVFRSQPAEKLTVLIPTPVTSYIFMNPETAASDIAELEPADLEIRFYPAQENQSLDSWLTGNDLLPADKSVASESFQTAHTFGLRVCGSTMIVPNCFYFIAGSDWIYQLIPITLEGEAIMDTFMLTE